MERETDRQSDHEHEADHRGPDRRAGPEGRALEASEWTLVEPMAADRSPATFTVPVVIDTSAFATPATRNVAINTSYHQFDEALTAYLGQPFVANWATFGKHASAHVGNEMAAADEAVRLINSLGELERIVHDLEHDNTIVVVAEYHQLMQTLEGLPALLKKPHVISQSTGMAIDLLTDTTAEMKAALAASHGGFAKLKAAVAKLVGMLPHLAAEINVMKDRLADGNRKIYENIAPCLRELLLGVQSAPDGIPRELPVPSDTDGFMSPAFGHYVEARKLTNMLQDPELAGRGDLLEARVNEVKRANMILVTHEQMIAQPDYDAMPNQMAALAGRMTLEDPTGTHVLLPSGGNWGNFYERLGYDRSAAPADFRTIDPNHLPPLLPKTDPSYKGTIAEYFDTNAQEIRLQQRPKQPTL